MKTSCTWLSHKKLICAINFRLLRLSFNDCKSSIGIVGVMFEFRIQIFSWDLWKLLARLALIASISWVNEKFRTYHEILRRYTWISTLTVETRRWWGSCGGNRLIEIEDSEFLVNAIFLFEIDLNWNLHVDCLNFRLNDYEVVDFVTLCDLAPFDVGFNNLSIFFLPLLALSLLSILSNYRWHLENVAVVVCSVNYVGKRLDFVSLRRQLATMYPNSYASRDSWCQDCPNWSSYKFCHNFSHISFSRHQILKTLSTLFLLTVNFTRAEPNSALNNALRNIPVWFTVFTKYFWSCWGQILWEKSCRRLFWPEFSALLAIKSIYR